MVLGYTHRSEPHSVIIRKVFKPLANANKYRDLQPGITSHSYSLTHSFTHAHTHSLTQIERHLRTLSSKSDGSIKTLPSELRKPHRNGS